VSERNRFTLAGWAIGVLTTVALGFASWGLLQCSALGQEQARQKQETADMRELLLEIRKDVKDLMRRKP